MTEWEAGPTGSPRFMISFSSWPEEWNSPRSCLGFLTPAVWALPDTNQGDRQEFLPSQGVCCGGDGGGGERGGTLSF